MSFSTVEARGKLEMPAGVSNQSSKSFFPSSTMAVKWISSAGMKVLILGKASLGNKTAFRI